MHRWQYQSRFEPLAPLPEPIDSAEATAVGQDVTSFVEVPPDHWTPRIPDVLFDVPRTQYTYPSFFFGDNESLLQIEPIDSAEATATGQDVTAFVEVPLDHWEPRVSQPLFDVVRNQHLYPSFFPGGLDQSAAIDSAEATAVGQDVTVFVEIPLDNWEPRVSQPLFDLDRRQYLYPEFAFGTQEWLLQIEPIDSAEATATGQDVTAFAEVPLDHWEPRIPDVLSGGRARGDGRRDVRLRRANWLGVHDGAGSCGGHVGY